jgi:hypothetical protein
MTLAVAITDPLARQRKREPIVFSVAANLRKPLWWARDEAGKRVLYQRLTRDTRAGEMRFIATEFQRPVAASAGRTMQA